VVFQAIVNGSPTPPRQIVPSLPPALEQVVLRATHVDPKKRYPSVKALGRALLPFVSARGRLLWSEAFPGVEEDEVGAEPPLPGRAGGTAMMPAVEPQSGVSTAKVANRSPAAGQGRRGSAGDEAPVPPGTATLDVVSPRRYDARLKKLAAIGAGLAAAIAVAAIVSSGGKGKKDEGVRASAGPVSAPEKTAAEKTAEEAPSGRRASATPAAAPAAGTVPLATGAAAVKAPEVGQPVAAEPASSPEEPEPFVVAVTTVPGKAELELDGERVGRGRLRRSLPADHEKHVLRVSAEGFESRVLEFTDRPPPAKVVLVALPPPVEDVGLPDEPSSNPSMPSLAAPSPRRPTVPRPGRRPPEPTAPAPPPSQTAPMNPNGAPVID